MLAELLEAAGLDVVYVRALGDRMWFADPTRPGETVEVLDLLSGFGAALLGHNHPEVVARARALLDAQAPFHAQASVRGLAGRLGERLSRAVGRATGREYVVTLASTGAEAVEAALKHAELEAAKRAERLVATIVDAERDVRLRLKDGTATIRDGLLARAERALDVPHVEDLDALAFELARRAARVVETPPAFVALEGSFHGKTLGALSLTHRKVWRRPWLRMLQRARFVPFADAAELERIFADETETLFALAVDDRGEVGFAPHPHVNISAVLVEPIQGEGGIREVPAAFLARARELADRAGCPLVLDEIQSGMGRTGTFLASEAQGVRGDYYTLAKSLGAGLGKVAALLVDRGRYVREFGFLHTTTFGEDDHGSALGLAALDLIERDGGALLERCRAVGERTIARLRDVAARHPRAIRDVRGRGLMIGVELAPQDGSPSTAIRVLSEQDLLGPFAAGYLLHEERVRVGPAVSQYCTLRVYPTPYVADADIERIGAAFERLAAVLEAGDGHRLLRGAAGAGRPGDATAPRVHPPPPPAPGPVEGARRVAFIGHFVEADHLGLWDPTLAPLGPAERERILDRARRVLDPFVNDRLVIRSATGAAVELFSIGLPFTAAQARDAFRTGDSGWCLDQVEDAVALARELGAAAIGFGGYSSIVTDNCRAIVDDRIALTSGNSFTVAAGLEGLLAAARAAGIDPARARLGAVGAAGNIASTFCELAADAVPAIVLIGRPGAERRLRRIAARIAEVARERGRTPPEVTVESDLAAVSTCDLVVTSTNAARPILLPEHFPPDRPVVVCDVAVPHDTDPRVALERPNVRVIAGGLVRLPFGQRLAARGLPLEPGQVYACLAETLLLGLTGIGEPFSYGPLVPEKVRRIAALSRLHGFEVDVALEKSAAPTGPSR